MTLVHGLVGGRQAVVVRVHHAVTDGLGALNCFVACTSATPEAPVATAAEAGGGPPTGAQLTVQAMADLPRWGIALVALLRDGWVSHRRAKRFRARSPDAPPFLGARRTLCNVRSSGERRCASAVLPFDDFQAVARSTGSTINGVLHAVVARALRWCQALR